MCLSIFGVDALYPTLTLFVAQSLPQADQALGGGLINSVLQIGRAMGVAIATAVQMAVEAKYAGGGVNDAVSNEKAPGDPILLKGLRAANWFDVGLGVAAFVVVMAAFRGVGKIGLVKK